MQARASRAVAPCVCREQYWSTRPRSYCVALAHPRDPLIGRGAEISRIEASLPASCELVRSPIILDYEGTGTWTVFTIDQVDAPDSAAHLVDTVHFGDLRIVEDISRRVWGPG